MASISWKSGVSGSWTNAANWVQGSVPGLSDDVLFGGSGSYSVTASAPTSARSITLAAAGATITESSTLTLGGVLSLTAGTFVMNGAVIMGGTVSAAGGDFQVNSGTLNGVRYLGALNLTRSGTSLSVAGALSMAGLGGSGSGTVNLTGTSAIMAFVGTQTFDNATVNFGSSLQSSAARFIEKDVPNAGATLTLGASLNIVGNGGYGFLQSVDTAANDALVNAGTISFGSSGGLIEVSANRFVNSGKLKVSNGGSLYLLTGPYGVAGGEVGSNSGSISISSGLLAFGSSFTSTGSIVATGGTVTIAGTFATTGVFQANNTQLTIGGTISGGSLLALLNNTSDTVTYTATYENSGAVLNIGSGSAIGTLSLTSGLPIRNGTIADAGGGFVFNGGTLTNVAYQGTVDLSRNGANLNLATRFVATKAGGGSGAVTLTGTSSVLSFMGSQTFDSATVTIGSSVRTSIAKLQERDLAGTGATLTFGAALKVVSNGGSGLLQSVNAAGSDVLVNKGTIQVATAGGLIEISANSFTNQGALLVGSGGTLDVLTGPYTPPPGETGSNTGVITASGGLLNFGSNFTNNGSITVNGGTLTLAGTFTDAGTLRVANASVTLGGRFSGVSFLKMLNDASDTVTVTGTYDNSGGTLNVGAGSSLGSIELASGLPISGGTIVDTGGGLIYAGGTLDGVTYVGTMTLGADDSLDVIDGLVVQTGTGGGPGIVNLTGGGSAINLLNAQTLDDLTITVGDATEVTDNIYNNAVGTVTLGPDLRVQQSVGVGRIYTYATATTVNQGRIAVSGGTFQIDGSGGQFVNAGSISVSGTASLIANAFFGSPAFSNTGRLSATDGASVTLEAGWSNTGTLSANGATLRLGSDTATAWSDVGTITAVASTLELLGAFTRTQLKQIDISGGVTRIIGALDNSGGTLMVGQGTSLGVLTMAGGTITGGMVDDSGEGLAFGDGTLDAVTYRGALTVGAGGSLWVADGLALFADDGISSGTLNLTGGSSGLFVLDSETLDDALIRIGDSSGETDYIESYVFPSTGTLTLGSGLQIRQSVGDAAIYTSGGGTTVNDGQILVQGGTFHVDYGTFVNNGTISATGASALFSSNTGDFTNAGLLNATSGGDIALQAGWSNTGTISVSGGDLQLGSDQTTAWGAIGNIVASSATLDLYGAFTTAQLQSLTLASDTVDVDGSLDNSGGTLAIGLGTSMVSFGPAAGGVVRGGVITDAGGGFSAEGGTLDGVTYRGVLAVGAGGSVSVRNGLTERSFSGGSPGTIMLTGGGSSLVVLDSETLDNATIVIGDASGSLDVLSNGGINGNTLTLGAGLVVQQSGGQAQILATGSNDDTINLGRIVVSGGTLDIGGDFSNAGTISISNGAEVTFDPGTFDNYSNSTLTGGVYVVGAGSTLELAASSIVATLNADLTLSGAGSKVQALNASGIEVGVDTSLRTIGVSGALRLLSGRSLAIQGSLLDQGKLQLGGGTLSTTSTATISGTLCGYGTVVGGLTDSGLIEATGGLLTIVNVTSGSGRLQVDAGSTLELGNTSALDSAFSGTGGTLLLDKPSTYSGTIGGFAAGDTIVLTGVTASTASIAGGTLSVNLTNGGTLAYDMTGSFSGLAVRTAMVGGDTVVTLSSAAPTHITGLLDNQGNTLSVGSGTTLYLDGGTVLGGTIADSGGGFVVGFGTLDGVTYRGALTVGAGGLLNVVDGLTTRSASGGTPGSISLAGGGSTLTVLDTETLDQATITIGDASGTADILANGGADGTTLTLGANLVLQQSAGQAQILSAGSSDLTVNRGRIAVSGGTLDISGGRLSNVGTINVSGGGQVVFETGTFANFAGSTLTGGVYVVGAGSTLQLARSSFVSTISADVSLSGTASLLQSLNSSNVQTLLDSTWRTISAGSALRLLAGRSMALKAAVLDQGTLQLAGGTLSNTSTTTIAGTLFGYGTVVGSLSDGGLVEANGGRLTIANVTSGAGQLQVDAGATLELANTSALGSRFSGAGGTLQFDKPSTYTGTIGGFALGQTIVLGGVTASSAGISGGTLSVGLTDGRTLSYAVTGSFTGLSVRTASSGGNTLVTLSSGSGSRAAAAEASLSTRIETSNLSLASAGFLDRAGGLAGSLVAAAPNGTLTGQDGVRDVFTGATAAFDGDRIVQFAGSGGAADLLHAVDLAFATATAWVTPGEAWTKLDLSDGARSASLTLLGATSASHFLLMGDGQGGTLVAHR